MRTFARVDDLSWNVATKSIDVTITSRQKQDITLIVRYGIESISAPAGVLAQQPARDATTCVLHLPADAPVTLHLKIGPQKPSDWVAKVAAN